MPYNNVQARQKIIIYNSGSFGQHLYSSLEGLKQFQIIAWVDEDYDESVRAGIPITKISLLERSCKFDHILIASVDMQQSKEISDKLQDNKVPESKIKILNIIPDEIDDAIKKIGFSLDDYAYENEK